LLDGFEAVSMGSVDGKMCCDTAAAGVVGAEPSAEPVSMGEMERKE